jgi:hypothetical protein
LSPSGPLSLRNATKGETITIVSTAGWADGDVVVIDAGTSSVTLNGSASGLSLRAGSVYPLLSPGTNALEVGAPNGLSVSVSANYRSRY